LGVYQVTLPESPEPTAQAEKPLPSTCSPCSNQIWNQPITCPGCPYKMHRQGQARSKQCVSGGVLAMLALGLLVGEWLVYQRGALARLRDWLRGPAAARGCVDSRKVLDDWYILCLSAVFMAAASDSTDGGAGLLGRRALSRARLWGGLALRAFLLLR
jgi:hypothetical protein